MRTRPATPADAPIVARIYNQGVEERIATFETRPRSAGDIQSWLGGAYPTVVVEDKEEILAFATTSAHSPRECYAGVAELSVYTAREAQGRGAGRVAMEALIAASEEAGFWKLVSRVFVENGSSRRLLRSVGFREVGVHEKHARLDGVWRDVVIVERLLTVPGP